MSNTDRLTMHGPAEFEMQVYIINDETEQTGKMTVGIGVFEYPTRKKIVEKMRWVEGEVEKHAPGFRLMTKREAFEAMCIENFGQPMALASGPEWDSVDDHGVSELDLIGGES